MIAWIKKKLQVYYLKGHTAHEIQFGRVYIRICHLSGAYWKNKPWRRFSVQIISKADYDYTKDEQS